MDLTNHKKEKAIYIRLSKELNTQLSAIAIAHKSPKAFIARKFIEEGIKNVNSTENK